MVPVTACLSLSVTFPLGCWQLRSADCLALTSPTAAALYPVAHIPSKHQSQLQPQLSAQNRPGADCSVTAVCESCFVLFFIRRYDSIPEREAPTNTLRCNRTDSWVACFPHLFLLTPPQVVFIFHFPAVFSHGLSLTFTGHFTRGVGRKSSGATDICVLTYLFSCRCNDEMFPSCHVCVKCHSVAAGVKRDITPECDLERL